MHYLFFKHALMKMFNLIDIGERAGSGIPKIVNIWNDYSQISKSWGAIGIELIVSNNQLTLSLVLISSDNAFFRINGICQCQYISLQNSC